MVSGSAALKFSDQVADFHVELRQQTVGDEIFPVYRDPCASLEYHPRRWDPRIRSDSGPVLLWMKGIHAHPGIRLFEIPFEIQREFIQLGYEFRIFVGAAE